MTLAVVALVFYGHEPVDPFESHFKVPFPATEADLEASREKVGNVIKGTYINYQFNTNIAALKEVCDLAKGAGFDKAFLWDKGCSPHERTPDTTR